MGKIFIYSIPRKTATGISEFSSEDSGMPLNKTKFGLCTDSIEPLYNVSTGRLNTGLDAPYMIEGKQALDPQTKLTMTIQDFLEKKHNKPKGYYSSAVSISDVVPTDIHRFDWSKQGRLVMNDGCTVLDLDTEIGEVQYYMVLASKYVANSEKDYKAHKYPFAKWYIAFEGQNDIAKYEKNQLKSRCFASLHDKVMTDTAKRKMAVILELLSSKSFVSNEQIANALYDYIESGEKNCELFLELFNLLSDNKNREDFENRYFLKELMDYRIVFEKQGSYTWIRPKNASIVIGENYAEAIAFLSNPKKAVLVDELKEQLKITKL